MARRLPLVLGPVVALVARVALPSTGCTSDAARATPQPSPAVPSAPPPQPSSDLPDVAGPFQAAPADVRDGFVRRIYTRGATRVNVTLGVQGAGGRAPFEQWVSMSVAYPQIPLMASPDDANGFFDCRGGEASRSCDAHVHFRNGLHLELFGEGTASEPDLNALLSALPVEAIATRAR